MSQLIVASTIFDLVIGSQAQHLNAAWSWITSTPEQNRARETSAYYRNCDAARLAGAAPIYRGLPGYRPEIDGESDGVACQPFRGQ